MRKRLNPDAPDPEQLTSETRYHVPSGSSGERRIIRTTSK
jgi:hypothetical protein